jgi:tetratricopeptide (TPR) repeat protein
VSGAGAEVEAAPSAFSRFVVEANLGEASGRAGTWEDAAGKPLAVSVLVHAGGRVLALRRRGDLAVQSGLWTASVTGTAAPADAAGGDALERAALRELAEETGLAAGSGRLALLGLALAPGKAQAVGLFEFACARPPGEVLASVLTWPRFREEHEGAEFRLRVEERLEREFAGDTEGGEPDGPGAAGLEKRIAELEKKLAEAPGDPKLLWKLAVAYRNAGEYDKAIAVLRELQEKLPQPAAKVAVLLAQCLRAKGDREAALAALEELVKSQAAVPGAVRAFVAILKEELGRVADAAEELEKAVASEPKDKALYKKLGELYRKAHKEGVKVFANGKKVEFDVKPFIENGRTLVPIRAVAEALGLAVDYKDGVATITNPANGRTVILYTDSTEAVVDGKKVTLDVPARVIPPGRTIVPLRFVSENLGADVEWFEDGQVIAVNEK